MFIAGPSLGFMASSRESAATFSVSAELHKNQNESVYVGTGNFTNIIVFILKSDKFFQRPWDRVCKYVKTIVMHFLTSFMQSEFESDIDLLSKY